MSYVDVEGNEKQHYAKLIILAAFTVQNPRLMLTSANTQHPNGLANSSNLVGKYIMSHPSGRVSGLFNEDTQNYFGVTGGQLLNQDNYKKDQHKKGFGSYSMVNRYCHETE